ncbi:FAD-dependent oxidoreductase [Bradyrhizobium acaciae]|uniref:FAD-dependent oxidoreductase n=1 Tax=Bradyrhizobium acaciae TaxID=2683706 RepID=UPI00237C06AB|nr:FAD-dependent oxidoreductase [Bradyrhizobium acaciae]
MTSERFDVVILGGGNAGIGVTGPVRRAGFSVAMIEPRELGGTCPNRGCTPKKILVAAGQALHDIDRASVHHIAVGKPRLNWGALIDREKAMITDIPSNLARAMRAEKSRLSGVRVSSLPPTPSRPAIACSRPSTS